MSGRPPGPRAFYINFGEAVAGPRPYDQNWWMLEPVGPRDDRVAAEVTAALRDKVVPFLARYGTDSGYRDYLLELPPESATAYLVVLDQLRERAGDQ